MESELSRATRERNLFLHLLELGLHDAPEVFLEKALSLFIEVAGAQRGYIELREPGDDREQPTFSLFRGIDNEALSPGGFSRSVICETFATGETVVTTSAIADPRFQKRSSVRAQQLEAVLCAPIGTSPVLGVIYLQDRLLPGPFSADDQRNAEVFARHVASFADRLLIRHRQREKDPTSAVRAQLRVEGVVGSSEPLAAIFQQLALVAPLNIGVLLTGACGTGKTQLARVIHDNGPRASFPFVELNCAAFPEELVESELFGASPGAHSTALRRVRGKVTSAENGTLFLDEIAELPLRAQAKLLQLLQSGTYYPLGDSTPCKANVRVIAATNVDLAAAVAKKQFREDLYYRLSVFPLRVPTLAERRQDIPALAAHFCEVTCETNGLPALELSAGALRALEHSDWPGNIRELAHLVQAGAIRAHGDGMLRVERRHLFPAKDGVQPGGSPSQSTFHEATRTFQRELLCETLEREDWNVAAAARTLDLTRAHVYNLMATLSIARPLDRGQVGAPELKSATERKRAESKPRIEAAGRSTVARS